MATRNVLELLSIRLECRVFGYVYATVRARVTAKEEPVLSVARSANLTQLTS